MTSHIRRSFDDTDFDFDGSRIIDGLSVLGVESPTVTKGTLRFGLTADLAQADAAVMELYVCGETYEFREGEAVYSTTQYVY